MNTKYFVAFLLPSVIFVSTLVLIPIFICCVFSFEQGRLNQPFGQFVGFQNYINVLNNWRFWNAVKNTMIYIILSIPFELIFGFLLAVIIDKHLSSRILRHLFIAGILSAHIVTPVVGALIFSWLFRQPWGLYSSVLGWIRLTVDWYGRPWPARLLLIMYEIWQNTPLVTLIVFAGLQALPATVVEAGRVDGASEGQLLRYIIIPMLEPLLIFAIIVRTMDAYRVFDSVFVMTGGGPGTATELLAFYNYVVAFRYMDLGQGAAIAIITVVIITLLLGPFVYKTYASILK